MFDRIPLSSILFLDIETVPAYRSFDEVPPDFRALWELKSKQIRKSDEETAGSTYHRAGIYAEFGKIICISCGMFTQAGRFRIKSFFGDDEAELLKEFAALCEKSFNTGDRYLCAHNGKEFDFPYLSRRMIIHGIPLPNILNTPGRKPWEVAHLDTHELWKFGDHKSYTSLNLLATVLGIPTPKDDIDGSKVWEVYWVEKNLQRIVTYCQKDTLTVACIFLRLRGEPLLDADKIEVVP